MGRKTRLHNTDNNPGVSPPLKVELSEKNKKLRMAAIIGFLAIALIIVGAVLYHETITANKIIGIVICLIGLYFIKK